MKTIPFIVILLTIFSCSNTKENIEKETEKPKENIEINSKSTETDDLQNEVMKEEDILFNGKLKRYFTSKEFESVIGKPDSMKLMSEEAPCSYIFENEDGSKNMQDKYAYKDGSQYEISEDKVAVDEFRFLNENFILFKGKKLSSNTTITELKKIFPNAIKNISTMDVYGEGELQVIELREDENHISDGHIKIFFKNDKLYFMHWWFPC